MIIHGLRVHGPHAFPRDGAVDVDAERLPAIIGVSGPNGQGKTTLFDAIPGALYLVMPYRPGALHRNFVTKGGIGLIWEIDGQIYRSSVSVDPEAERTEASLFAIDDVGVERLVAGPLVKDYRRAVERILGPLEIFLASVYAVQNGAGAFLRLARPERKALLSELLGLGAFPRYHEAAKTRGSARERELEQLRARCAALVDRAAARPGLESRRLDLSIQLTAAEETVGLRRDALATAMTALQAAKDTRATIAPLADQVVVLNRELAELTGRLEGITTRQTNNQGVLARTAEIRDAVARYAELAIEIETIDGQVTQARASHQTAVRAQQQAQQARNRIETGKKVAEQRKTNLERQAGLLTTVPCKGEGVYAGCAFLKDARSAVDALPGVTAEITEAAGALERATVADAGDDGTAPLLASKALRVNERSTLLPTVQQLSHLDAAQARLDELATGKAQVERDLVAKTDERTGLQQRLEELPGLDEAVMARQRDVNAADESARRAQQDVTVISRELGELDGQVTAALAAETELQDLQQRQAPIAEDLADWTLLAKAFGASGIPALLIDTALPEIGAVATDLLRVCFGEEIFTIRLTTQRDNAAGDKLLETLDVVVRRGADSIDAALLSGGESVLVSEALSLALALYTATRSGRRIQTLLRDEVSAPLDISRAPAYVRMLRRAAELGGFRHVFFVSHQPACLELADAQLLVAGGQVTVA